MSKIETVVYDAFIVAVDTRSVSNGTKTIWEVSTQDGTKWATFNTAMGNKAKGLSGQMADLQVAIEQKGDFTNYYLQGIQPAKSGAQPPAGSEVVQAAQRAQEAARLGTGAQNLEVTYDQYKDLDKEKEDRKNKSIHRQTATKVAASLLPSDAAEFWMNVRDLVEFYGSGFVPTNDAGQIDRGSVTSHTDLLPSTQTDADFQGTDDDIPF